MKKLSIEEKTKRYDEILAKAKRYYDEYKTRDNILYVEDMEDMFPELKESEDDRIRKWIIGILSTYEHDRDLRNAAIAWLEKQGENISLPKFTFYDILALQCCMETVKKVQEDKDLYEKLNDLHGSVYDAYHLENQGEQKSADKVEPKFKVGDYVVGKYISGYISEVRDDCYLLGYQGFPIDKQNNYHLWTIHDAKDGDVLATKDAVFIFKHKDKTGLSLCKSYCEVIGNSELGFGFDFSINGVYPATKKQRDLLFKKMKEAGYEWDADKKELKKIED